ncbi:uncharacterized protein LOC134754814 [Cydia strobilella]|uniref:uncharacterized protein LOC134754814 n=1 Tax=Cydia strobilella TaxID=1100964 RepID=UPI003004FABB
MDSTAPFQPWAKDGVKNVKSEREQVDDAKLHQENVNHPKHTQTASYDKDSISASNEDPGPSIATDPTAGPSRSKEPRMDSEKIASMQQFIENTLSHEGRQRVGQLLEEVESLSGAERLLLYLRLPTGIPPHDPLKQPINPLGSRAELQQTVTWIQTHLEVDPDVSLPKQDVYDEYIAHCMSSNMKPLSTADFGKVMKQVYPSVRPRRLGTRGNSRYCYAGLRKKIKLEVPQLPDLGESSKGLRDTSRDTERTVLDWAESKLGIKLSSMLELSRHVASAGASRAPAPPSHTPPPLAPSHVPGSSEDPTNRQLMKQLKRKLQTQGTPGRPKKNKGVEISSESPPSTSYTAHGARGGHAPPGHAAHAPVKHESEPAAEPPYHYQPAYVYEARPPSFPPYAAPPRAHPPPAPHPAIPGHDYRPDAYVFEPPYAPRDLTLPADATHNLPINLSSDASLDLSTERTEWQRRRPPEPPPAPVRLHLPGKKLILETYQSETRAGSPRPLPADSRAPPAGSPAHAPEDFPRTEYLPKKMRAAEILGGKLSAARHALAASTSASGTGAESLSRSEVAFLEDPKNVSNRSKSTAAALAREQQEAASPTRSVKAPTPKCERSKIRKPALERFTRTKRTSTDGTDSPERSATPDSCCGLDGINIKTGMICEEKHSEILNRERVISICNIDKHALDDYLNEGNSQEHEEELLQYFHQRDGNPPPPPPPPPAPACGDAAAFLDTGLDPQDDHSQGKNEKISQLRELLAKNLKNQSGSSSQSLPLNKEIQLPRENVRDPVVNIAKSVVTEGAFKPVINTGIVTMNGSTSTGQAESNSHKYRATMTNGNGSAMPYTNPCGPGQVSTAAGTHLYNGNSHNVPQSPTTRTQQYDFVPISDGCHSPGNFHTKSPVGFVQRGHSPSKMSKPAMMGGSLQTSPISHSTAASPFVSPRNTPVPRSRLCPRPIPKLNGRKKRNPLSLGVGEPNSKPFAIPNDQKFFPKTSLCGSNVKYCQPMSAPPSPNILTSQYKSHMFQCNAGVSNGSSNLHLNFLPNVQFRDGINGDMAQPLSADPLSSEVSQFFQESLGSYRAHHEACFRSQSVPLKPGVGGPLASYMHTPVGSVPPTPVPNEFCDFGSLADTCDISKAGLNPETLDKIYDAIDSSNNVLNSTAAQNLLSSGNPLSNRCDPLPEQQILSDEQLNSLIPGDEELLDQSPGHLANHFNHSYPEDTSAAPDNVEDFLKRAHSIEFDLSELVTDKNKYYTSRSVPSTPLPFKRAAPNSQIDSRRPRELFGPREYSTASNGISSKSVPSTPQLAEERSVFSYSNRDFLINGNSVEVCGALGGASAAGGALEGEALGSPLHEMDMLEPLTPAAELLADLDKIDGPPYVDL